MAKSKKRVTIQKSVRGKPLEIAIGELAGVQEAVRSRAKEIEAQAEEHLQPHHFTGGTYVALGRARANGKFAKGWSVTLIDPGGYEGAIEKGRDPYLVEDDPQVAVKGKWTTDATLPRGPRKYGRKKRFTVVGELYGGMEGLFILDKAVKAVKARHRREFR